VKAIAIVSGGLDSVTLAHTLKAEGYDLHLLSFNYGQRHAKELEYAKRCAEVLGARWSLVDLSSVAPLLTGSALTDAIPVPDGHYAAENMRVTVVPNRNAVMLAIAYAAAVSEQADAVAFAVHGGDHFIYPDCRPEFVRAFDNMQRLAVQGHARPGLRLLAPFLHLTKADIVRQGAALGVDYAATWSCYKGGAVHCGTCGTCVERKEAFELAGVVDPTIYQEN
jgi:7-cyano-7-deazaguanine synthase